MNFVNFSIVTTAVPVANLGIVNGYKLTSILHGGRKISLEQNNYYYIPHSKSIVAFRGSKAKVLVRSDEGKYNFIEKFKDRKGHWAFKVDASMVHQAACSVFGY